MEYREQLLRSSSIEQRSKSPSAANGTGPKAGNKNNRSTNVSMATSSSAVRGSSNQQSIPGAIQRQPISDDQSSSTPKKAPSMPPPLPPRSKKRDVDSLSPLGCSSVIRQKASSPTHTTSYSVNLVPHLVQHCPPDWRSICSRFGYRYHLVTSSARRTGFYCTY